MIRFKSPIPWRSFLPVQHLPAIQLLLCPVRLSAAFVLVEAEKGVPGYGSVVALLFVEVFGDIE